MADDIEHRLEGALAELPGPSGGIAIVLATAGVPPAMVLLSSGDVHIANGRAMAGVYAASSAVERLGDAFSLLVPLGEIAVRVEVASASATVTGPIARIEGEISSIRPTAEPPWVLEMGFLPEPGDHPSIPDFIEYWRQVKAWLEGHRSDPPSIPELTRE